MSLTHSNMFPLHSLAPQFSLLEPLKGRVVSLVQCKGEQGTVVVFMCNHCPFVVHVLEGIIQMANDYKDRGVNFIGINSNDIASYPDDAPEKMAILAKSQHLPFPYLFDETQSVAKAYDAACTPDFYVFNRDLMCVYRGQMDGARPGADQAVTGEHLRKAMDALLSQTSIIEPQQPSIGCNIKWKA